MNLTTQNLALSAIFCIVWRVQPIRHLEQGLRELSTAESFLYSTSDLKGLVPSSSPITVLLSRAVKAGILEKVCRGIFLYPHSGYDHSRILYHTAARLRINHFCYLSLESVLSEHGIISQLPMQWITIMTSGRSNTINCGKYGKIEFIHTAQRPSAMTAELNYDRDRHLWVSTPRQALRDMKATRRSLDLVNPELAYELV